MLFSEQGTMASERYAVVPRTLVFLVQAGKVLLLRGAANKRLWANRLNGIGGHIEPEENIRQSAMREFHEETGLQLDDLRLRALIHVQGQGSSPGVILYVFLSSRAHGEIAASQEGSLEWHPLGNLPTNELVEDVAELLPRILNAQDEIIYGLYQHDDAGLMHFRFGADEESTEAGNGVL